jgi:hypothetical protein
MVAFKDLGLSVNEELIEAEINGKKFHIKKYLPIEKKASIINLAVNGSIINGIVNEVFMDAYFHLFLIEHYTDISFEDIEPEEALACFDALSSNDLLDEIISKIPESEFEYMYVVLQTTKNLVNEYQRSPAITAREGKEAVELLSRIEQYKNKK